MTEHNKEKLGNVNSTQCKLDIFCVLSKTNCRKFKMIYGFREPEKPVFFMYVYKTVEMEKVNKVKNEGFNS